MLQAGQDERPNDGMRAIHRVAAAGIVDVFAGSLPDEVVALVVDAAVAVGRAISAGFAGMVVDHVEPHLDSGCMKSLHHVAKFPGRVA